MAQIRAAHNSMQIIRLRSHGRQIEITHSMLLCFFLGLPPFDVGGRVTSIGIELLAIGEFYAAVGLANVSLPFFIGLECLATISQFVSKIIQAVG